MRISNLPSTQTTTSIAKIGKKISSDGLIQMLTPEQTAELEFRVYQKVKSFTVTYTTRQFARDIAGIIVEDWQEAGEVPMGDFGVELTLVPFEIHVDWV